MKQTVKHMTANEFEASIEPVFYCGLRSNNRVSDNILPERTFDFFEYRLKQTPQNLLCHLQRIQFSLLKEKSDEVFAAICDLFIILGDKGLPLRRRVSIGCKRVLNKKQIDILNGHLLDNVLTDDLTFLPDSCFFKKRPFKLIQLPDSSVSDEQRNEYVLFTADSYIENSQFEVALEYMVACLKKNPGNRELTVKLIELYKTLGYANEFQNAYDTFSDHLKTSRYWDDAKKYFE